MDLVVIFEFVRRGGEKRKRFGVLSHEIYDSIFRIQPVAEVQILPSPLLPDWSEQSNTI